MSAVIRCYLLSGCFALQNRTLVLSPPPVSEVCQCSCVRVLVCVCMSVYVHLLWDSVSVSLSVLQMLISAE